MSTEISLGVLPGKSRPVAHLALGASRSQKGIQQGAGRTTRGYSRPVWPCRARPERSRKEPFELHRPYRPVIATVAAVAPLGALAREPF